MAVSVTRQHPFDHATARERVDALAQSLSDRLSLRYAWEGDRLAFKRRGAHGHIDVTADAIHVAIRTSPLLPVSDAWLRKQVDAVLDEHLPPDAADTSAPEPVGTDDAGETSMPGAEAPAPEDPEAGSQEEGPEEDASPGVAGPLGTLASGLIGVMGKTTTASMHAVQSFLLSPEQLDDLSETQRTRLREAGQQLRHLREQAGLTVQEVGRRLGLDPTLLKAAEAGTARLPAAILDRLAEVLPEPPDAWADRFTPPRPSDASDADA